MKLSDSPSFHEAQDMEHTAVANRIGWKLWQEMPIWGAATPHRVVRQPRSSYTKTWGGWSSLFLVRLSFWSEKLIEQWECPVPVTPVNEMGNLKGASIAEPLAGE